MGHIYPRQDALSAGCASSGAAECEHFAILSSTVHCKQVNQPRHKSNNRTRNNNIIAHAWPAPRVYLRRWKFLRTLLAAPIIADPIVLVSKCTICIHLGRLFYARSAHPLIINLHTHAQQFAHHIHSLPLLETNLSPLSETINNVCVCDTIYFSSSWVAFLALAASRIKNICAHMHAPTALG